MKTCFVLENYDNLQKNGRLGKVTGSLIQMLNIKSIMGADDEGNIALFEKVRGVKRMLGQLLPLIERSGKRIEDENLVISHCNNPDLAEQLFPKSHSGSISRRYMSFQRVVSVLVHRR